MLVTVYCSYDLFDVTNINIGAHVTERIFKISN